MKRSSLVLHKRYVSIYDQLTLEYTATSNDTLQRIDKIIQYHFTNVYREVNTLCVVSSCSHDNVYPIMPRLFYLIIQYMTVSDLLSACSI